MMSNSATKMSNQSACQSDNNVVADQSGLGFYEKVSKSRIFAEKQIEYTRLWKQLESIKAKNETTTELIKLYDEIKRILARLQQMNKLVDNSIIHSIIIKKFPSRIHECLASDICRKYNGICNLEIIMTIIENNLLAAAICEEEDNKTVNEICSSKNSRISTKSLCIYCKQKKHDFLQCRLSYKARAKVIIDEKRCKNCLSTNHNVDRCRSRTCRVCKTRHHESLCERAEEMEKAVIRLREQYKDKFKKEGDSNKVEELFRQN